MDEPLNPEGNRLYSKAADLHRHHWERLGDRGPVESARAAGCRYADGVFTLALAGALLSVDPAAREVRFLDDPAREPGFQRALVAVSYLANALDAPPSGRFVSPRELPGGDGFFRGPHAIPTKFIAKRFGAEPARLTEAATRLSGVPSEGGDAAAEFPALPKIPMRVVVWGKDEEMGAEASLLVDSRAGLHVPLDVLWALLNVVSAELCR